MVRKLMNLTLLAGALLALCGLMVSAASAATFTAEEAPTIITGEPHGSYKIEATGLAIKCELATFEGEVKKTSTEEVTLLPTFTECTAFGYLNALITGFSDYGEGQRCHFVVHANGTGDLVCPPEFEVTIDGGPCTVHLPPQSGLKGFTYTKITHEGVNALTVDINLTELHGSHTDGFLCPFNGGGTFTGTKAEGVGLVTGENLAGEPVGITWDE